MPILYLDWYTIHLEFIISSQTFQGKFTKKYTRKQTVHIISSTNNYFFFYNKCNCIHRFFNAKANANEDHKAYSTFSMLF